MALASVFLAAALGGLLYSAGRPPLVPPGSRRQRPSRMVVEGQLPRDGEPTRSAVSQLQSQLQSQVTCIPAAILDTVEDVEDPYPKSWEAGLLSPVNVTDLIRHGQILPRSLTSLISAREKLALSFLFSALGNSRLLYDQPEPPGLYLSGGYVRDLLLGKDCDDLDLSVCLRECPPSVTLGVLVDEMPEFAARHPELAVSEVEVITALSRTAQGKAMDTAQIRLTVCDAPLVVDLMPTIGAEVYDSEDRVPLRDCRGTVEQDALRRDLAINAILLRVGRAAQLPAVPAAAACRAALEQKLADGALSSPALAAGFDSASFAAGYGAAAAASSLTFEVVDYFGGLDDLRSGVLRSPFPRHGDLEAVWQQVFRSPAERRLAAQLGIGGRIGPAWACGAGLAEATEGSDPTLAMLQAVWWVKVLRDDPLRILRALRFQARPPPAPAPAAPAASPTRPAIARSAPHPTAPPPPSGEARLPSSRVILVRRPLRRRRPAGKGGGVAQGDRAAQDCARRPRAAAQLHGGGVRPPAPLPARRRPRRRRRAARRGRV